MTDDELRDLFSAYHDRELDPERSESVRVALEANPALHKEYKGFCAMVDGLQSMAAGSERPEATATPATEQPSVDLLKGVQRRIHTRSGGKFYRDRWSRTAGVFPLEIFAAVLLVALVLAYFAMTSITVRPAQPGAQGDASAQPAR